MVKVIDVSNEVIEQERVNSYVYDNYGNKINSCDKCSKRNVERVKHAVGMQFCEDCFEDLICANCDKFSWDIVDGWCKECREYEE